MYFRKILQVLRTFSLIRNSKKYIEISYYTAPFALSLLSASVQWHGGERLYFDVIHLVFLKKGELQWRF